MSRDLIWFILLPVAVVMGLLMGGILGPIQAMACAVLFGLKIWLAIYKK